MPASRAKAKAAPAEKTSTTNSSSSGPQAGGKITALDPDTVHRICTNQVIVSLETCLKELIENSLDANATSIQINLGEYGTSYIRFQDNGCGISNTNGDMANLCKRHHTSKLQKFSELSSTLDSYGFRGEALAAICALSEGFEVVSRHDESNSSSSSSEESNSNLGVKCVYGRNGDVISSEKQAMPSSGTIITVKGLFAAVPVRREDFRRNCKQRLLEAVKLIQQFSLSHWNIKFVITNEKKHPSNNNKSTTEILRSDGLHTSLRNAAINICGEQLKKTLEVDIRWPPGSEDEEEEDNDIEDILAIENQDDVNDMQDLIPIENGNNSDLDLIDQNLNQNSHLDQNIQDEKQQQQDSNSDNCAIVPVSVSTSESDDKKSSKSDIKTKQQQQSKPSKWRLHGIISTAEGGRTQKNLQYLFINKRPAEVPKKLGKCINETYKTFNSKMVPVFILEFEGSMSEIDCNVTPDKRTIFLKHEDLICEQLKQWMSDNLGSAGNFVKQEQSNLLAIADGRENLLRLENGNGNTNMSNGESQLPHPLPLPSPPLESGNLTAGNITPGLNLADPFLQAETNPNQTPSEEHIPPDAHLSNTQVELVMNQTQDINNNFGTGSHFGSSPGGGGYQYGFGNITSTGFISDNNESENNVFNDNNHNVGPTFGTTPTMILNDEVQNHIKLTDSDFEEVEIIETAESLTPNAGPPFPMKIAKKSFSKISAETRAAQMVMRGPGLVADSSSTIVAGGSSSTYHSASLSLAANGKKQQQNKNIEQPGPNENVNPNFEKFFVFEPAVNQKKEQQVNLDNDSDVEIIDAAHEDTVAQKRNRSSLIDSDINNHISTDIPASKRTKSEQYQQPLNLGVEQDNSAVATSVVNVVMDADQRKKDEKIEKRRAYIKAAKQKRKEDKKKQRIQAAIAKKKAAKAELEEEEEGDDDGEEGVDEDVEMEDGDEEESDDEAEDNEEEEEEEEDDDDDENEDNDDNDESVNPEKYETEKDSSNFKSQQEQELEIQKPKLLTREYSDTAGGGGCAGGGSSLFDLLSAPSAVPVAQSSTSFFNTSSEEVASENEKVIYQNEDKFQPESEVRKKDDDGDGDVNDTAPSNTIKTTVISSVIDIGTDLDAMDSESKNDQTLQEQQFKLSESESFTTAVKDQDQATVSNDFKIQTLDLGALCAQWNSTSSSSSSLDHQSDETNSNNVIIKPVTIDTRMDFEKGVSQDSTGLLNGAQGQVQTLGISNIFTNNNSSSTTQTTSSSSNNFQNGVALQNQNDKTDQYDEFAEINLVAPFLVRPSEIRQFRQQSRAFYFGESLESDDNESATDTLTGGLTDCLGRSLGLSSNSKHELFPKVIDVVTKDKDNVNINNDKVDSESGLQVFEDEDDKDRRRPAQQFYSDESFAERTAATIELEDEYANNPIVNNVNDNIDVFDTSMGATGGLSDINYSDGTGKSSPSLFDSWDWYDPLFSKLLGEGGNVFYSFEDSNKDDMDIDTVTTVNSNSTDEPEIKIKENDETVTKQSHKKSSPDIAKDDNEVQIQKKPQAATIDPLLSMDTRVITEQQVSNISFDKSFFTELVVHGQFNQGFIIASWNSELFILDQHACDEKMRFEKLNAISSIETQELVNPMSPKVKHDIQQIKPSDRLHLSPSQEQTVAAQLHVFSENGFHLEYENNTNSNSNSNNSSQQQQPQPGHRVLVKGLPTTNSGFTFGEKDILDLIDAIEEDFAAMESDDFSCQVIGEESEDPGGNANGVENGNDDEKNDNDQEQKPQALIISTQYRGSVSNKNIAQNKGLLNISGHRSCWGAVSKVPRPKKIWSLLASRACRSAIMIGRSLKENEMYKILENMRGLQSPFNCPHGRPTLKHLGNMDVVCKYERRGIDDSDLFTNGGGES